MPPLSYQDAKTIKYYSKIAVMLLGMKLRNLPLLVNLCLITVLYLFLFLFFFFFIFVYILHIENSTHTNFVYHTRLSH